LIKEVHFIKLLINRKILIILISQLKLDLPQEEKTILSKRIFSKTTNLKDNKTITTQIKQFSKQN